MPNLKESEVEKYYRRKNRDKKFGQWAALIIMLPVILAIGSCIGIAFAQGPLAGRASVIDGDTIELRGERIRFNGVDAPEARQTCHRADGTEYRCGRDAAEALDVFLAQSRPTRCEFIERDRYKRFVGDCFRADGQSVSEWLVANGHALDWPRYSDGAYADEQSQAEAGKLGVWQGKFEMPWEWRRR